MTIRINQIAVEFTLEDEKTLADLTKAVRTWAQGQDLAILGILADGQARAADDKTPLDMISTVDIEAVPAGERDLARVAVLSRFFSLLAQGWEQGNQDLVTELHQEYAAIRSAVSPLLDPLAHRLSGSLELLDGPWTAAGLAGAARQMADGAETRRRELQDPDAALGRTLDDLEKGLNRLEDLGLLFQQGRDKDGFDRILDLFTLLEDLARRADLVHRTGGTGLDPWTEFQADLKPLLQETEGALAAGDYILLTDLLEYEVIPRLRQVREFFPENSLLDRAGTIL